MDTALRALEWASASGVVDDPVFLTIFSVLGYRKLFFDHGGPITLLSIVLTALVAFTLSRAIRSSHAAFSDIASSLPPGPLRHHSGTEEPTPSPPPQQPSYSDSTFASPETVQPLELMWSLYDQWSRHFSHTRDPERPPTTGSARD